jgi:hypothetical protein
MTEIRIEKGTPTPEELAALVGVLLSRRTAAPVTAPRSRWAESARPGRRPGWRAQLTR